MNFKKKTRSSRVRTSSKENNFFKFKFPFFEIRMIRVHYKVVKYDQWLDSRRMRGSIL